MTRVTPPAATAPARAMPDAAPAPIRIETVVEAGDWAGILEDGDVAALALATARATGAAGEAALALGDDAMLARLNGAYRGTEAPTNVLSFPAGGDADGFLGDIALARETLAREAADQGKALRDHAVHLAVHGLLHLIGYDHETEDAARAMEDQERRILDSLGIADPYVGLD